MPPPRKFDHEDAVRRHAAGETCAEIAANVGVTEGAVLQAVKRATDSQWVARNLAYRRGYMRRTQKTACCVDCGATIWRRYPSSGGPGLRCRSCSGKARETTVRPDTLRCSECGEWKPDQDFPHGGKANRRGRHAVCRPCQAKSRQRRRLARAVPCAHCGKPRLDHRDGRRRGRDTGLCRPCWLASPECAAALALARGAAARRKLAP